MNSKVYECIEVRPSSLSCMNSSAYEHEYEFIPGHKTMNSKVLPGYVNLCYDEFIGCLYDFIIMIQCHKFTHCLLLVCKASTNTDWNSSVKCRLDLDLT
jgi:hypothetical protein